MRIEATEGPWYLKQNLYGTATTKAVLLIYHRLARRPGVCKLISTMLFPVTYIVCSSCAESVSFDEDLAVALN